MATMESHTMTFTTVGLVLACGSKGSENRMKPYVPIFNRTPARITEPAVGASTCASGSQVWNGNIGTLMAKPMANAMKTQTCICNGQECECFISSVRSNVCLPSGSV